MPTGHLGPVTHQFLARIIDTTDKRRCVQVFVGEGQNQAKDDGNWKIVFVGTQEECFRFTSNMMNEIEPGMVDQNRPLNPRRLVE